MNQIFDEPISMNQILDEPILMNRIWDEHGSLNWMYNEAVQWSEIFSKQVRPKIPPMVARPHFRKKSTYLLDENILPVLELTLLPYILRTYLTIIF